MLRHNRRKLLSMAAAGPAEQTRNRIRRQISEIKRSMMRASKTDVNISARYKNRYLPALQARPCGS